MQCKRASHSNCVHPEGCAWCGQQCTGLFCSDSCYDADRIEFNRRLDEELWRIKPDE